MRKNGAVLQQLPCPAVQKWKPGSQCRQVLLTVGGHWECHVVQAAWSLHWWPCPSLPMWRSSLSDLSLLASAYHFLCCVFPPWSPLTCHRLCVSHFQFSQERLRLVLPSYGLWAELPGHMASFWTFWRCLLCLCPSCWFLTPLAVLRMAGSCGMTAQQPVFPLSAAALPRVLCTWWRDTYEYRNMFATHS